MGDFLDWLSHDSPEWVAFAVGVLLAFAIVATLAATIASIAAGLWIIPVLIWFVAPLYLVIRAYAARDKDDT